MDLNDIHINIDEVSAPWGEYFDAERFCAELRSEIARQLTGKGEIEGGSALRFRTHVERLAETVVKALPPSYRDPGV